MSIRFSTAYRRIKKVLDDLTDTYSKDLKEAYELGYKVGFIHAETDLIVRCKDCKYLDKGENDSESWCECTAHFGKYFAVDENGFCSFGER